MLSKLASRFVRAALASSALWLCTTSQAAVIFQEDWQSNTIDPLKWNLEGGGGGPFVFDMNSAGMAAPAGDIALFLDDPTFSYTKGVRSVSSFSRALGLTASFKLMVQPSQDYLFTGVGGPWTNRSAPSGSFPSLEQIEAGISRRSGENYHYVEGTSTFDTVGFSPGFRPALEAATSKAAAVDVKVTLGTSTGMRLEWSVGGGPVTVESDTIGLAAGLNYAGANVVSSLDPLWLYFGAVANGSNVGRAVVDDIVVTGIPEPSCLAILLGGVVLLAGARRQRLA
jgi:hypothetical protein